MINNLELETAFRILRNAWFSRHLYSRAHEREWEDEERSNQRDLDNKELKKEFDEDTEKIINGNLNVCIAPTCTYDMRKNK